MAIELTDLIRSPEHRATVHVYSKGEESSLTAGDRIRVQVKIGDDPINTLMDETVPVGKVWNNVHFQLQAFEDDV